VFKLLKGGLCYLPDGAAKMDILVAYDRICEVKPDISADKLWDAEIIDCNDCMVMPGLIDQHVHITGGGGEQGPISRIPEITLSDVLKAGVTTLVGILGFDSVSHHIAGLLQKSRGLEAEGITTYIYTGSYGSPTETLTGRVLTDIVFLDKVIGVGEIAISDYRSNHPTLQDLKVLAAEALAGGMLGGKAGVLHIHVGDGQQGLMPLFQLIQESDFPLEIFVPTHVNRNPRVFAQGIEMLQRGGYIDLTAGETAGLSVAEALHFLTAKGIDFARLTISSDGNGSAAEGGVSRMDQLLDDLRTCLMSPHLDKAAVIKTVTENPAKLLKLYPKKGALLAGSDADILVLKKNDLSIFCLLARGELMVQDEKVLKKGRFEP
jgi:beta-aspartyl-dipeptidase (metallo-type)